MRTKTWPHAAAVTRLSPSASKQMGHDGDIRGTEVDGCREASCALVDGSFGDSFIFPFRLFQRARIFSRASRFYGAVRQRGGAKELSAFNL